ncbi:MAG: hypothetical protein ABI398_03645 [Devosia sp.]
MKLTWFGGTALRINIGGKILVCDLHEASAEYDRTELASGADRSFRLDQILDRVDLQRWSPRTAIALIDETNEPAEVHVRMAAEGSVLIDGVGEPPLMIMQKPVRPGRRWSPSAVIVAFSATTAAMVLGPASPRMIALAAGPEEIDTAFLTLSMRLGSTALVALEQGMALEV